MRMLRSMIVTLVLAVAWGMAPSSMASSPGHVLLENPRGPLVNASWSYTNGCEDTQLFVNADNEIAHRVIVPGTWAGDAAVSFWHQDTCDSSQSFYGEKTSLQPGELVVSNQLDSAILKTVIDVTDGNGNTFSVNVDLAWTGTGPIVRDHSFSNILYGGGCRIIDHWKGTGRTATASGTVAYGGTNYAGLAPLQWAEIGDVITGSEVINCG